MLQLNLNIRLLEGYKDLIYCRACLLKCKWKTKVTSRDEEVKERFPREINSDLRIKKINVMRCSFSKKYLLREMNVKFAEQN